MADYRWRSHYESRSWDSRHGQPPEHTSRHYETSSSRHGGPPTDIRETGRNTSVRNIGLESSPPRADTDLVSSLPSGRAGMRSRDSPECPQSVWDADNRSSAAAGGDGRRHRVSYKELNEQNAALRTTTAKEAESLVFSKVDLHKDENRVAHNTDHYDEPTLILRRGQQFHMTITFERDYVPDKDTIILQFSTGPSPQISKHTLIQVPAGRNGGLSNVKQWSAKVVEASGKSARLRVVTPADAVIGRYKMYIETRSKGGDKDAVYKAVVLDELDRNREEQMVLLFNAFCKDDVCYMQINAEREEYVMNESGRIWVGAQRSFYGRPWNFGQFDEASLRVALYLMDRAKLPATSRCSPIHVTRCISKMANNVDEDNGVIAGRWTKDYPGGKNPGEWNGSVAILKQYMETKKPVKYGQCWVFSGVVTTLCRALGLPTRSVTNFASAHDTDMSNTIDVHFDEEGNPYQGGRFDDSIWNFHVWNESWFKRPDLPAGHDGWQAHDATPQESSQGFFQCGPASVEAVKKGEVFLPYDTGFLFGEVNGDRISWTVKKDGSMEAASIAKSAIGKHISTKSVASDEREDITSNYKFAEGSYAERTAVRQAYSYGSRKSVEIYKPKIEYVKFQELLPEHVPIGSDVTAEVEMHNTSRQPRNVKVTFTSLLTYYTGVATMHRDSDMYNVELKAGEKHRVKNILKADEYMAHYQTGASLRVYIVGRVQETNQSAYLIDVIEFKKPELTLKTNREPRVGQEFELTILFKNPQTTKLTGGKFSFEGNNMKPWNGEMAIKGAVDPSAEARASFRVTPQSKRKIFIVANFSSDQLSDVKGALQLDPGQDVVR